MNLIPFPKNILNRKGVCELGRAGGNICLDVPIGSAVVRLASMKIADGLMAQGIRTGQAGTGGDIFIRLSFSSESSASERYRLTIGREGVVIEGEGARGVFRGAQTFLQLLKENGTILPCLEIEDSPDYPARGFLHDVTRGKVPTLATLKLLADKLAFYKINQLQLYIEHAFAFRGIPELWQDKDPLTAEEIKELDLYCRDRCIDLVPSLATFGHLYELLRLKRFEDLNELDLKASELPHSLWDRMAHYTIDVGNEKSFPLIKSMIDEFVPLFSSGFCNICCDETFDLGKGKNRKLAEKAGTGRLYIDFVIKLTAAVRGHGKTPMIWGDIVLRHPEVIGELPGDVVFLNWDYGAEVTGTAAKTFADAGVKQYVCPGIQG
ncbi:MAG: family 20 glycosylhydrolase, partial [Chitinispirillaceae bacterium]|nr:family 20 glycosylhydrolase [Chitinispirillaceae bacterium]